MKGKLVIYGDMTGELVSISALLKSGLLDEADAAFRENDRLRCMKVVDRLYSVFDDEYEAD